MDLYEGLEFCAVFRLFFIAVEKLIFSDVWNIVLQYHQDLIQRSSVVIKLHSCVWNLNFDSESTPKCWIASLSLPKHNSEYICVAC